MKREKVVRLEFSEPRKLLVLVVLTIFLNLLKIIYGISYDITKIAVVVFNLLLKSSICSFHS